jgi:hypothetical protein
MTPEAQSILIQHLHNRRETTIAHLIAAYRNNTLTDAMARGKIGELSVLEGMLEDLKKQRQREEKTRVMHYQGVNGHGS